MSDWIAREREALFQNYGRQPIVVVRGEGTRVWDDTGKEYLDFVGGLAVNILGHAHPVVAEAVAAQAKTLIHMSGLYYTTPMIELGELLTRVSGLDRAFFCNSGTEAVEAAIKLARRWGKDTKNGAYGVISTIDGFHGRSMGALAATGNTRYREPFEPLPPGFTHVPWNDLAAIKSATTPETVAVLLEPIQGEGGVNMPGPGYLKAVQDWCREKGLLFILDEIQTGMGRTGTLFAFQQEEGVLPDVMCIAKGLAGGIPIGAVLAKEDIAKHLVPGDHGTTFGGNPLATATAIATLNYVLQKDLPAQASHASDRFVGRLRAIEDRVPGVTEIRGRGLLLAMAFSRDCAADVVAACREKGLLVNNVRPNAIRFMPPLNVSDEEIDRAAAILEEALVVVGPASG